MTLSTTARGDDSVAPYSSRGPTWYDGLAKPDLVAPGQRLVSNGLSSATIMTQHPGWTFLAPLGSTGSFVRLSGTSMATGVVSGVAALVLEANRTSLNPDGTPMAPLSPYDVKAILEYTATNVAGADALTQGAGELNAVGALSLTLALDTRSAPWLVGAVAPSTTIGNETLPWAMGLIWGTGTMTNPTPDDVVWGTHLVWGNHVVWGNDTVWANNIVWGNHVVWGNNIVWGNHVVWGNHIVWGNHVVWGNSVDYDGLALGARSCNIDRLCQ
jgi:serine protease AprX